jgi:predicted kinase
MRLWRVVANKARRECGVAVEGFLCRFVAASTRAPLAARRPGGGSEGDVEVLEVARRRRRGWPESRGLAAVTGMWTLKFRKLEISNGETRG